MSARKRIASYEEGIEWIAMNDDLGEPMAKGLGCQITVALLADLFGVSRTKVARDVVAVRKRAVKFAATMGRGRDAQKEV